VLTERQLLVSFVSHWPEPHAAALSSEAGRQTYLLADYLLNGPQTINQAAAALQQTLLESDHVYAWLEKYGSFEEGIGLSALRSFERQLWFFAYAQMLSQAPDSSTPCRHKTCCLLVIPLMGQAQCGC
jgi:hypothetical protein